MTGEEQYLLMIELIKEAARLEQTVLADKLDPEVEKLIKGEG